MVTEQLGPVVLWGHLVSTVYMTGLIWFVQVVHYPLKAHVGAEAFQSYQAAHVTRTGWVVMPPMLIEAFTATWLVIAPQPGVSATLSWTGLGLLIGIWLSTALFQIPAHRRLESGQDAATVTRLVRTNWIRTIGWSARCGLAVWLTAGADSAP